VRFFVMIAMAILLILISSAPALSHPQCLHPVCGPDCPNCHVPGVSDFIDVEGCIGSGGQGTVRCHWGCCDVYGLWEDCVCLTGGGGGCFLAGTPIVLADGSNKPIEKIQPGDTVLARDTGAATMVPALVNVAYPPRLEASYLVVNGTIRVTASQPVLSGGKWLEIGTMKVGDQLTAPDGSAVPIRSLRVVPEAVTVYNLQIDRFGTYVAGGVVVHNKPLPYTTPGFE
jgi:hypothetical protein